MSTEADKTTSRREKSIGKCHYLRARLIRILIGISTKGEHSNAVEKEEGRLSERGRHGGGGGEDGSGAVEDGAGE
jgi:hypothetical protein